MFNIKHQDVEKGIIIDAKKVVGNIFNIQTSYPYLALAMVILLVLSIVVLVDEIYDGESQLRNVGVDAFGSEDPSDESDTGDAREAPTLKPRTDVYEVVIEVSSRFKNANIFLDGERLTNAPATIVATEGPHELKVEYLDSVYEEMIDVPSRSLIYIEDDEFRNLENLDEAVMGLP